MLKTLGLALNGTYSDIDSVQVVHTYLAYYTIILLL